MYEQGRETIYEHRSDDENVDLIRGDRADGGRSRIDHICPGENERGRTVRPVADRFYMSHFIIDLRLGIHHLTS